MVYMMNGLERSQNHVHSTIVVRLRPRFKNERIAEYIIQGFRVSTGKFDNISKARECFFKCIHSNYPTFSRSSNIQQNGVNAPMSSE